MNFLYLRRWIRCRCVPNARENFLGGARSCIAARSNCARGIPKTRITSQSRQWITHPFGLRSFLIARDRLKLRLCQNFAQDEPWSIRISHLCKIFCRIGIKNTRVARIIPSGIDNVPKTFEYLKGWLCELIIDLWNRFIIAINYLHLTLQHGDLHRMTPPTLFLSSFTRDARKIMFVL